MRKLNLSSAAAAARSILAGVGFGLVVAAAGIVAFGPASWLPIPLAKAQVQNKTNTTQVRLPVPRMFQTQQTHFIRSTLTFGMCVQVTNACTVRLMNASLPYNAIVARVTAYVITAFNSTTSDVLIVGTTSANANEIVSSTINIAAAGNIAGTVAATAPSATGNTAVQSGANGGLDVWVKWTAGTGNTATTGLVSLVIEYFPPIDGLCTPNIALGAAPAGC